MSPSPPDNCPPPPPTHPPPNPLIIHSAPSVQAVWLVNSQHWGFVQVIVSEISLVRNLSNNKNMKTRRIKAVFTWDFGSMTLRGDLIWVLAPIDLGDRLHHNLGDIWSGFWPAGSDRFQAFHQDQIWRNCTIWALALDGNMRNMHSTYFWNSPLDFPNTVYCQLLCQKKLYFWKSFLQLSKIIYVWCQSPSI